MADIAASNVTYATLHRDQTARGRKFNQVSVAFGNGALTYPTGGVPLSLAGLGIPNAIVGFQIEDASKSDGYMYKWDSAANKIRIYQGGASTSVPGIELTNAAAPAATTLVVRAIGW